MPIYKKIDNINSRVEELTVHKIQIVNSGSSGIQTIKYISGSSLHSGSHWSSLHNLFYMSGSPIVSSSGEADKYSSWAYSYGLYNRENPQHRNKFKDYGSGSLIGISAKLFGETIKPNSFILRDNSNISGTIVIRDDGYGNLYPVGNTISHSTNSPSASDNYVGNIFYDWGIVTITETGTYSHTPSTASINVGILNQATISSSHFFVSKSSGTSVKFISTGSYLSETETDTIKYFGSGSTSTNTAISGTIKINEVFDSNYISASSVSNVITMSNNANSLNNRRAEYIGYPISGAGGFNSTYGFSGGNTGLLYNDIGTNYELEFKSTRTVFVQHYNFTINPGEFNGTTNWTARGIVSSSSGIEEDRAKCPYLIPNLTASNWSPYITSIHLYGENKPKLGADGPLIVVNLPKPIKSNNKITLKFNIPLDR